VDLHYDLVTVVSFAEISARNAMKGILNKSRYREEKSIIDHRVIRCYVFEKRSVLSPK
jgi:hypothetical protein